VRVIISRKYAISASEPLYYETACIFGDYEIYWPGLKYAGRFADIADIVIVSGKKMVCLSKGRSVCGKFETLTRIR